MVIPELGRVMVLDGIQAFPEIWKFNGHNNKHSPLGEKR